MKFKKLKWFTIAEDAFFFFILCIMAFIIALSAFFGMDEIFFAGQYVDRAMNTDDATWLEDPKSNFLIETALNLFLFVTILRSGRSNPENRLAHMSCVAFLIWLLPASNLFFEQELDFLWHICKTSVFIVAVASSFYIHKYYDRKNKENTR